jgi:cytochrome P450
MPHKIIKDAYPLQQALAYRKHPIRYVGEKLQEHPDWFGLRFGNRTLYIVAHPDYVQHVLQQQHRNYIKAVSYKKLQAILGEGLLTSDGEYWLKQRRLMQPIFHRDKIAFFQRIIAQQIDVQMERWKDYARTGSPVNLFTEMSDLALRIVCEALLGVDISKDSKSAIAEVPHLLHFITNRVFSPFNLPLRWPLPAHQRFKASMQRLSQLIHELIEQRLNSHSAAPDLITQILMAKDESTGEGMSKSQVFDEVITFFLAGHETSAIGLTCALYLLGKHPDIEAKARQAALAGDEHYLKLVAQETLRIYPPIWTVAREAIGPDQVLDIPIRPGDTVVPNMYWLHRHPAFWEQAEDFRPERFENDPLHKYAYVPFGGGPRICIGMHFALLEMSVGLQRILSQFRIESLQQEIDFDCTITIRPSAGPMVRLHAL